MRRRWIECDKPLNYLDLQMVIRVQIYEIYQLDNMQLIIVHLHFHASKIFQCQDILLIVYIFHQMFAQDSDMLVGFSIIRNKTFNLIKMF